MLNEVSLSDHPKCQAKVVTYGRLSLTRAWTKMGQMFYSFKSQFQENSLVLLIVKYRFFALAKSMIMLLHQVVICFSLHYLSSGCLWKVKNNEKFQTGSRLLTRGGCLQEVPNRVIWLGNFCYFGKLVAEERCLLMRGGCKRRFDCMNDILWKCCYDMHNLITVLVV